MASIEQICQITVLYNLIFIKKSQCTPQCTNYLLLGYFTEFSCHAGWRTQELKTLPSRARAFSWLLSDGITVCCVFSLPSFNWSGIEYLKLPLYLVAQGSRKFGRLNMVTLGNSVIYWLSLSYSHFRDVHTVWLYESFVVHHPTEIFAYPLLGWMLLIHSAQFCVYLRKQ